MVPPPVRLTAVVALASLPLFDFNGVPQTRRSDAGARCDPVLRRILPWVCARVVRMARFPR